MGRKGNWLSAIKKVFTSNSKDKLPNETEKKNSYEKKGRGKLKHGESRSFIPLFREPSSIEKILGEVDQQYMFIGNPTPIDQPTTPQPFSTPRPTFIDQPAPRPASPGVTSQRVPSPRVPSPRLPSSRTVSPKCSPPRVVQRRTEISYRPHPTLRQHHLSATTIQAAYRGYMARRSFRALRGLVRLQGVLRGQNVKRQTVNAMKQMQLLVRVQTQIQSRRIQMLENEAVECQNHKNENESSLGKWNSSNLLEAGDEHWDHSLVTKEEREARLQKKMEAVIKRERAMAYAYSHQLWKAMPKSAQNDLTDVRSGGYPWWWNWLERQLPTDEPMTKTPEFTPTPARSNLDHKTSPSPRPESSAYRQTNQSPRPESSAYRQTNQSPRPESSAYRQTNPSPRPESGGYKQTDFSYENLDTFTPKSSRSTVHTRTRQPFMTPTRTPPSSTLNLMKYSKPKGSVSGSPYPMKDDDSLMSCPPFSVPNYMSPTVSAKAKVRPTSNPKDRLTSTAASETSSKRRFSFPLAQNIGSSFKWNKKFSSKDSTTLQAPRVLEKHKSPQSIGDRSIDSTTSMPAAFGKKPFNRYV